MIRQIRSLLYDQGFTIGGARQRLSGEDQKEDSTQYKQLIHQMISELEEVLKKFADQAGLASRERHSLAFSTAIDSLRAAKVAIRSGDGFHDIAAEDIRSALRRLDSVVGRVDVENLLDVIFSSFCLGK